MSAMKPTKAATAKGSSTRLRILAAARAALIARDREGLVMREVAEQCGIRLGNLQYYFPTTETLVLAVIEAESAKDLEMMENAGRDTASPADALERLVRELITRWRGESGPIFAILNQQSLHSDAYRALFKTIYRQHYRVLEAAIDRLVPGLPPAERAMRARLLTALIDGSPYQTEIRRKPFTDRIVDQALAIAREG
ncbi:MAG: TetR/AcrR family transcriptional regulator [Pseudomonadota bacterium]